MAFSNTHFSLSVHVLTTLALFGDPVMASTELAAGAGTNPAFLRQVVAQLRTAELIESRPGNKGGLLLAKPSSKITLADVYLATKGKATIASHTCPTDSTCPVATNFDSLLSGISSRVNTAVVKELSGTTIADLAAQVAT